MDEAIQSANYEQKIEFLKLVIESAEKRRDKLESRFGALIASDAILLTAIVGIVLPAVTKTSPAYWYQVALTVVSLVLIMFSTVWSAQFLIPFISQKSRSRIMDVPKDSQAERNLYLCIRVAEFKKDDYHRAVNALTEQGIFEQLLSEAHNLSRLLNYRYKIMTRALISFALAIVAFAFLAGMLLVK